MKIACRIRSIDKIHQSGFTEAHSVRCLWIHRVVAAGFPVAIAIRVDEPEKEAHRGVPFKCFA